MLTVLLLAPSAMSGVAAMLTLAAAPPTDLQGSLVLYVLQFGLVGALLIDVFVSHRFVVPRWVLVRVDAEHHAQMGLKDEIIARQATDLADMKLANATLQELTRERVMPALTEVAGIARDYVTELRQRPPR